MPCLLHLIALATVMNQTVFIFDNTQDCGLFAPAGRFVPANVPSASQIYAMDYSFPLREYVLAHEFCHREAFMRNTTHVNSFIDEVPCYAAGFDGLLNPGKYALTDRTRVSHGGQWLEG
jgi:hypothetical protein